MAKAVRSTECLTLENGPFPLSRGYVSGGKWVSRPSQTSALSSRQKWQDFNKQWYWEYDENKLLQGEVDCPRYVS